MAAAQDTPNRFRQTVEEYPYNRAASITPDDANDLSFVTRAIYVGGGGNDVAVVLASGDTVTFKAVPTGTVLPIRVARVKSTGTTATNLVALW